MKTYDLSSPGFCPHIISLEGCKTLVQAHTYTPVCLHQLISAVAKLYGRKPQPICAHAFLSLMYDCIIKKFIIAAEKKHCLAQIVHIKQTPDYSNAIMCINTGLEISPLISNFIFGQFSMIYHLNYKRKKIKLFFMQPVSLVLLSQFFWNVWKFYTFRYKTCTTTTIKVHCQK